MPALHCDPWDPKLTSGLCLCFPTCNGDGGPRQYRRSPEGQGHTHTPVSARSFLRGPFP